LNDNIHTPQQQQQQVVGVKIYFFYDLPRPNKDPTKA